MSSLCMSLLPSISGSTCKRTAYWVNEYYKVESHTVYEKDMAIEISGDAKSRLNSMARPWEIRNLQEFAAWYLSCLVPRDSDLFESW